MNIRHIPENPGDKNRFFYSDNGAWYGFALPPENEESFIGGFVGPYLIDRKEWISRQLLKLVVWDAFSGKRVRLKLSNESYPPGYLEQKLEIDSLMINLALWFATDKTAFLRTELKNTSHSFKAIILGLEGSVFSKNATPQVGDERIEIKLKNGGKFIIKPMEGSLYTTDYFVDGNSYLIKKRRMNMLPNLRFLNFFIISYVENENQWQREKAENRVMFHQPEKMFVENKKRWKNYAEKIFSSGAIWASNGEYQRIAMKSLITLMTNYRSAKGALKHSGIIPSAAVTYFGGFWAWDSWKHAAALASIDGKMAEKQIYAMFDFQNEAGMIPDCVFPDAKKNNWRNTKPPLAAWAVWQIFGATKDTSFVKSLYPKLLKYHRWWYKFRDHDGNGLCEYGSTDGTKQAALWESGMDNAVRFDDAKMVKNGDANWSLTQESVDLNSYLFAEKNYLAQMAELLGKNEEAKNIRAEAEDLKQKIQSMMFNEETGYFYDIDLNTKQIIPVQGAEGWIPLWAKVATAEQAGAVKNVLADTNKFATFVPFPTVARDNEKFSLDYWRGPVWLDQAYFAVRGLKNYGYNALADKFTQQIFGHLQGLADPKMPIFENYDPLTGKGLNAPHFSWSAAHLLMLLMDK
ncbi:MAG: glycoside hydrolase [Calditrichaeota bacterium]|nr:glycoside hydrolase [Calditrichota bacterium]